VGAEPNLDLAFLRLVVGVDGKMPKISQISWGDSSEMKPGYWAFAIGDPFGIEQFFAPSVLSATPSRDCYQEKISASYLQTAMNLHPEAIGGPLVDIDGNVIGLLAPRERSTVIGPPRGDLQFALPSNILKGIAASILEKSSFDSPWLGFSVMSRAELREELGPRAFSKLSRPEIGVYIENTFDPSPAHEAGIRPGDFLVAFDGHPIHTPIEFQKFFYLAGAGTLVDLEFFRAGETIKKSMRIEERPPDASSR
jgi:S1-C subfamily serine protease